METTEISNTRINSYTVEFETWKLCCCYDPLPNEHDTATLCKLQCVTLSLISQGNYISLENPTKYRMFVFWFLSKIYGLQIQILHTVNDLFSAQCAKERVFSP